MTTITTTTENTKVGTKKTATITIANRAGTDGRGEPRPYNGKEEPT
jgi:hypothetical protein